MTTLLLAALSAVLYGAGVAVEHRQAARTPDEVTGRPWLLARLARQPLWLIGAVLEAGGFVLHTAALRTGSLLVVQMILGCSLLVSLALSSLLARRPLPRRCWPAILALVASVGVGVALLGPDQHAGHQGSAHAASAALITGLLALPLAAAGLLATRRRARALLLAVSVGVADTCVAVLTMAFAHTSAHGLHAVLTSWPLYALIVGGLASLALTQAAYQTDSPLVTLPIISAVTPLGSLTVGILALHEATRLSATRSIIGVICLAVAITAIVVLARAAATRTAGEPPEAGSRGVRLDGPGGPGLTAQGILDQVHHPLVLLDLERPAAGLVAAAVPLDRDVAADVLQGPGIHVGLPRRRAGVMGGLHDPDWCTH
jgi:drug/metabolite transporter (DMT)-like permease